MRALQHFSRGLLETIDFNGQAGSLAGRGRRRPWLHGLQWVGDGRGGGFPGEREKSANLAGSRIMGVSVFEGVKKDNAEKKQKEGKGTEEEEKRERERGNGP